MSSSEATSEPELAEPTTTMPPELWAVVSLFIHRKDCNTSIVSVHPTFSLADDWARWHCHKTHGEVHDVSRHPDVSGSVPTTDVYCCKEPYQNHVYYAVCLPAIEAEGPPKVYQTEEERLADEAFERRWLAEHEWARVGETSEDSEEGEEEEAGAED